MHATHGIDVKNVIIDAALNVAGKVIVKTSIKQEVPRSPERREKFLKKHKTFFFQRNSVTCENLNFNDDKNWSVYWSVNLKCFYFIIIILISTSIKRELQRIKFEYNMLKYLHFQHHKIFAALGEVEIRGRRSVTKH